MAHTEKVMITYSHLSNKLFLAVGCVSPNLACLGIVGQCASHVLWKEGGTYARQMTDLKSGILLTCCCSMMI